MNRSENLNHKNGLEIAIVGMAGRFPGAATIDQFWRNLRDGIESITFFTDEELKASGVSQSALDDPAYVKARGVLDDIEMFDAPFFGIHAREAETMDPQHRLFLETAWESLENAGYNPESYQGAIGVYAGVGMNTYLSNLFGNIELLRAVGPLLAGIGNDKDHVTTRVSYKLSLKGPSVTVQTSCSTSLVAVYLASQALLSGACDIALAGGASINVPHREGYWYQEGGINSPDGHCRAFDAQAQGFASGSGVGVVVLKRLDDALDDGDTIHAVIKGSAINNDGSAKVGYTAPSIDGQTKVIHAAQVMAEVDSTTISYVEAHGTGTALGDPIEVTALTQAFRSSTQEKNYCALGSVKSNIGHLDTASGVTGLIKTVLALKEGYLPPSLHFQQPNPQIDFAQSPFFVNTELRPWTSNGSPRRAAVSSFGIGGTNAHVILEEAPEPEAVAGAKRGAQLLLLSARSEMALESATDRLLAHLKEHPELSLADVAYTLQVGRKSFAYRRTIVAESLEDAIKVLETREGRRIRTGRSGEVARPIVFMFPGQGAQYLQMGRELYETEQVYREVVDQCAELIKEELEVDLREVIYANPERLEQAGRDLDQTRLTQPALFVTEYALARLCQSWGIEPQGMIGHSLGEYVAACLASVMTLEEALHLVVMRGRLMQQVRGGAMLSLPLSESETEQWLERLAGRGVVLWLAAVNGDQLSVVSGSEEAIAELQRELAAAGVVSQELRTSHAFHSGMMDGVLAEFGRAVERVELKAPQKAYLSNLTGDWISAAEATDRDYWVRHLRQPVRYSAGLGQALKQSEAILLEVGPGETLSKLALRHPEKKAGQLVLASMQRANRERSDEVVLLEALGQLWIAGVPVNWTTFNAGERRRRIPLPTYPFERQRYWIEASTNGQKPLRPSASQRADLADWFYVPVWKQSVSPLSTATSSFAEATTWLIFVDECGLGNELAQRLKTAGQQVVEVRIGDVFRKIDEHSFEINLQQREDYETLLKTIRDMGQTPDRIVHLWGTTRDEQPVSDTDSFEKSQQQGFYSLLFLAQALGEHIFAETLAGTGITRDLEITVVTNNMQKVNSDEVSCPEKITALGACRGIAQEYPHINCRSIDLILPEPGTPASETLLNQLVAEITTESSDNTVAYRHGDRWIETFEPVHLDSPNGHQSGLREGGVYLVTGGLGGIGFTLAGYLSEAVRAKLILIGRSPFPGRDEWELWLQRHDYDHEVSRKIRQIRALEERGAEILILQADVTDETQMRAAIARAKERFGQIHGCIHAAGLPPEGLAQRKTPETASRVLGPKVRGTKILKSIFQDDKLDFLLLCSSLRAYMPGPGAIDYCAANLFLDAFARNQNSTNGRATISVNWDGWREVGMSASASAPDMPEEGIGSGMSPREGVDSFSRILRCRLPQIAVSTHDLDSVIEHHGKFTAAAALDKLINSQSTRTLHDRPDIGTAYVAPTNEIEEALAKIWQNLLGVDRIGIHDNFFELGGDSVIGLRIIAKANQMGLGLAPRQVFEYQTIAELAAVAGSTPLFQAEQGLVTGTVPLTPIQRWFFEPNQPNPHHWNQSFLFEVAEHLDPALMPEVVRQLLLHHDVLRLRFTPGEAGWEQVHAEPDEATLFSQHELKHLPMEEQGPAVQAIATELQGSLNISQGPLMRVAHFNLGDDQASRLLIIIHHLVVDNVSWRVLLDDLYQAYRQLRQGQRVEFHPKTTSFQYWSRRLTEYAKSPALQTELDYWLDDRLAHVSPLPVDHPGGANDVASACDLSVSLSIEESQNLLREVPKSFNIRTRDALLTALVQTFAEWTGEPTLLLAFEGHGREPIFEEVDLSRTVGWFTSYYPVRLDLGQAAGTEEAVKLIKEQVRGVPGNGLGYGLLRYLSEDESVAARLSSLPQPQVNFLFMGQYEEEPGGSLFRLSREAGGPTQSPQTIRPHLLDITGHVVGSQLHLVWTYSSNIHTEATIERLAQNYVEKLRSLIACCLSSESGVYTPSDFPGTGLSRADLDEIIAELSEFED